MEQTDKNCWAWADPENESGHIRMMNVDFYVKFYLLLLNAFLLTVERYLVKKNCCDLLSILFLHNS